MIKIPFEEILLRITEKTGIEKEELEKRIELKQKQLSGLISKEGAAHIIANELGVRLFENASGKLQIKNILTGMRDVETVGVVERVFPAREFTSGERQGKVGSVQISDDTGTIRVVMWGEKSDILKDIKEGDTIKIRSGYVKENRDAKEIHLNDRAKVIINPPDEKIILKVKSSIVRDTAKRKMISELKEGDSNVELFGTIVQAFEPRFYEVCPLCFRKARQTEAGFVCETHGPVLPKDSVVANILLDDGTENIRTVFFRDLAAKLFKKDEDEIAIFKNTPEKFDIIRNELLGNQIKVVGRVNKNALFNRIEFITQKVDMHPSPDEEIRRMSGSVVTSEDIE